MTALIIYINQQDIYHVALSIGFGVIIYIISIILIKGITKTELMFFVNVLKGVISK
jgi:hypothetical protein